jgi:AcrR family transcriptional regulator
MPVVTYARKHSATNVHWTTNFDRLLYVGEDEAGAPRRRLTQAEAKERTRAQLLAAAAQVFARKGFAGASLEEIAEQAGYSTGAVYYNFANKEQLFLELLRSGRSQRVANRVQAVTRIFTEAAASGGDPFATLSKYISAIAGQGSEMSPLAAESWLYAVRNPEAMELVAANLGEEDRGLEPVIAAAMERFGTPPGISSDEMALVATALFNGLVRRRRIDPGAVPDDLFGRVLRRLFGAETETETDTGTGTRVGDDQP